MSLVLQVVEFYYYVCLILTNERAAGGRYCLKECKEKKKAK